MREYPVLTVAVIIDKLNRYAALGMKSRLAPLCRLAQIDYPVVWAIRRRERALTHDEQRRLSTVFGQIEDGLFVLHRIAGTRTHEYVRIDPALAQVAAEAGQEARPTHAWGVDVTGSGPRLVRK